MKVISLGEYTPTKIPDPSRFRGFDAGPATQLCKKASATKSQRGHAEYRELLRRSKRSCKNEVVVPTKKKNYFRQN
jgi:hypothetical protein